MTKPITITMGTVILDAATRKEDAERAARNHSAWAAATPPDGPGDIRAGDIIVLREEQWQRGFGVVDSVDAQGHVWATFGQREHPHPDDGKTVRCFSPWREVRIVDRGAVSRAELQKSCRHPVSIDTLPAFCGVCGKELP